MQVASNCRFLVEIFAKIEVLRFEKINSVCKKIIFLANMLVFFDQKLQSVTTSEYFLGDLDLSNYLQKFIFSLTLRSPRLLNLL